MNVSGPVDLTKPEASVSYAAKAIPAIALITVAALVGIAAGRWAVGKAQGALNSAQSSTGGFLS